MTIFLDEFIFFELLSNILWRHVSTKRHWSLFLRMEDFPIRWTQPVRLRFHLKDLSSEPCQPNGEIKVGLKQSHSISCHSERASCNHSCAPFRIQMNCNKTMIVSTGVCLKISCHAPKDLCGPMHDEFARFNRIECVSSKEARVWFERTRHHKFVFCHVIFRLPTRRSRLPWIRFA